MVHIRQRLSRKSHTYGKSGNQNETRSLYPGHPCEIALSLIRFVIPEIMKFTFKRKKHIFKSVLLDRLKDFDLSLKIGVRQVGQGRRKLQ